MLQKRRIWPPATDVSCISPNFRPSNSTSAPISRGLTGSRAAADDIRGEFLDVMSEGFDGGWIPMSPIRRDCPWINGANLNHSRRWGVYSLWREGKGIFPKHIARCPKNRRRPRRPGRALGTCPAADRRRCFSLARCQKPEFRHIPVR